MAILLHVLAAALYAVAAWVRWPAAEPVPPSATLAGRVLVPAALAVHTVAMGTTLITPQGVDLSLGHALSMVGGLCVLVAWVSGLLSALPAIAALVLPVAAAASLLPAFGDNPHPVSYAAAPLAVAHIAIALLAYALLMVAAIQAMLLTGLEKRLHRGLSLGQPDKTPPLLTLERYLFRLVVAGFVLLTLTVASGVFFSEEIFGQPLRMSHKTLFSVLAWLTFGALLAGRWRFGWRGRKALHWILAGTTFLILAYIGSKFVLEVLLHR
jgi:ABC-type uncharacterized transport system permease subunit